MAGMPQIAAAISAGDQPARAFHMSHVSKTRTVPVAVSGKPHGLQRSRMTGDSATYSEVRSPGIYTQI